MSSAWSSTYIKATGKNIQKALEFLQSINALGDTNHLHTDRVQDNITHSLFSISSMEIIRENGIETLVVEGEGRLQAPYAFFDKHLFKQFNLSGSFIDEEEENDFFLKAEYKNGNPISRVADTYFCKKSLKEYEIDYWIEHYQDDFRKAGKNWRTDCRNIVNVFKSGGYDEKRIEKMFKLADKEIVFLLGDPATGKTMVAEALVKNNGYDIVKSTTTREKRNDNEEKWFTFTNNDDFNEKMPFFAEQAQFGKYMYGTTEEAILGGEKKRMVKIIEPKGYHALMQYISEKCPNVKAVTIYMDVSKQEAFNNLKKEGILTLDEIEKRLERQIIPTKKQLQVLGYDAKKMDIKITHKDINEGLLEKDKLDNMITPIFAYLDFAESQFSHTMEHKKEYTIEEVLDAMKETKSPPKDTALWYDDKDIVNKITYGMQKGWVNRTSYTQVEWTQEGFELASKHIYRETIENIEREKQVKVPEISLAP